MKKVIVSLLLLLFCSVAVAIGADLTDVQKYGSCSYCGMFRDKFAHSRMLITYDDQSQIALCSLHCCAVDLANQIDKVPVSIQVGDFDSNQLIDAENAFWVLGGDVPGVMTARPKWAFADKTAAEVFITAHGGELSDFEGAMAAAHQDMYRDTKMIRDKRKAKRLKLQQQ